MTHAGSTSMARYFLIDRGKAISVATLRRNVRNNAYT